MLVMVFFPRTWLISLWRSFTLSFSLASEKTLISSLLRQTFRWLLRLAVAVTVTLERITVPISLDEFLSQGLTGFGERNGDGGK